ncbi:MAG: rod shape-determining protein RodA [bacterium]
MKFGFSVINFKRIDWLLLSAVTLLICFGLSAIYSVALGRGAGELMNFQKQLTWVGVGIFFLFILYNFDYHYWRLIGWFGYAASLVLLILVLTPLGSTVRGTSGWFNLGLFSFQPVELTKIFLIMVLADIYSRHGRVIYGFRQLAMVGGVVLIPLALVMLQPDLGSGMILFFTWFISLILVTKNKWQIILIAGAVIVVFLAGWFFLFKDYQRARIMTFIDPSLDPLGRGYNVQQSLIAVGGGRLMGKGLGFGSQSQLKFIPESQTDFIFAVIAEEMGLIGVTFILSFYALIFFRLYRIATRAPDDFGMFLALFIMLIFFVQMFINIGMCMGISPVTGISLPFVSYGGSFLITAILLIGIALNINKSGSLARRH